MPKLISRRGRFSDSLWRIRFLLCLFFLTIAGLGLFIVKQALNQLKWESFHRFQLQAIEFSERADKELKQAIKEENQRGFGDYSFAIAKGELSNAFIQPSPLSTLTPPLTLPGLLGYFQLDEANHFSSPVLPEAREQAATFGLNQLEITRREQRQQELKKVLFQNGLLEKQTNDSLIEKLESEKRKQETQLRLSKTSPLLDDFKLDDSLRKKSMSKKVDQKAKKDVVEVERLRQEKPQASREYAARSSARVEKELLYEQQASAATLDVDKDEENNVLGFLESQIGNFTVVPLETGHLLFYRQIWQQNRRYLQGFILLQHDLLEGLIHREFKDTSLATMSTLAVVWQNQVIETYTNADRGREYFSSSVNLGGAVLHKQSLPAPFGDWQLVFTIEHMPAGPGSRVILFSAFAFLFLLLFGCILIYLLLIKHLRMAQQQQNFVSSISHELKTPLTSIRMYGEMLKEGWVSEEKKGEYYEFIFHESERLTRLINNILQLARMTRSGLDADLKVYKASELLDLIRSTISTQVEISGFTLEMESLSPNAEVEVDADLFLQVVINLVDNALKFSRKTEDKRILIRFFDENSQLKLSVRDFGPGIDQDNLKKIFSLFFRVENELTRETKGTGIGLALVSELLGLMNAKIEVSNCDPGAKFTMIFPRVKAGVVAKHAP